MDCPVSQDDEYNSYYGYTSFYGEPQDCDPTVGASYAFVACGNNSGPGACPPRTIAAVRHCASMCCLLWRLTAIYFCKDKVPWG